MTLCLVSPSFAGNPQIELFNGKKIPLDQIKKVELNADQKVELIETTDNVVVDRTDIVRLVERPKVDLSKLTKPKKALVRNLRLRLGRWFGDDSGAN